MPCFYDADSNDIEKSSPNWYRKPVPDAIAQKFGTCKGPKLTETFYFCFFIVSSLVFRFHCIPNIVFSCRPPLFCLICLMSSVLWNGSLNPLQNRLICAVSKNGILIWVEENWRGLSRDLILSFPRQWENPDQNLRILNYFSCLNPTVNM